MNVYQIVTQKVIESLEKNQVPWKRTWSSKGLPGNAVSGKTYRGFNVMTLMDVMHVYGSPWFVTDLQAKSLGGTVKDSEKENFSIVTYWKIFEVEKNSKKVEKKEEKLDSQSEKSEEKDDGLDEEERKLEKRFILRYSKVYNVNQCEGLKLPKHCKAIDEKYIESLPEPQSVFDDYVKKTGVKVDLGSPSYYPSKDTIRLPKIHDFNSSEAYYATAFHEVVHSTGHMSRLQRFTEKVNSFGSETYSKEELVAELGASFLCHQTKIEAPVWENSVAYIQNWIKVLKDNPKMIVFASTKAQKAVDFVLSQG